MAKVYVELDTSNTEDKKRLMDLIDNFVPSQGQQKLDSESIPSIRDPDAPATPNQKNTLRKFKIVFDDDITKKEASRLIKESMESK